MSAEVPRTGFREACPAEPEGIVFEACCSPCNIINELGF